MILIAGIGNVFLGDDGFGPEVARRLVSTGGEPETTTGTADTTDTADGDERAFASRFRLVHEWRKFLFDDPGLPAQLLPRDWPGVHAAELFTREAARLKPAADRFVGRCLGTPAGDGVKA